VTGMTHLAPGNGGGSTGEGRGAMTDPSSNKKNIPGPGWGLLRDQLKARGMHLTSRYQRSGIPRILLLGRKTRAEGEGGGVP